MPQWPAHPCTAWQTLPENFDRCCSQYSSVPFLEIGVGQGQGRFYLVSGREIKRIMEMMRMHNNDVVSKISKEKMI